MKSKPLPCSIEMEFTAQPTKLIARRPGRQPAWRHRSRARRLAGALLCLVALPIAAWATKASGAVPNAGLFLRWERLHNPVLQYPHWSVKDAAMAMRHGVFYIFFSAFYFDRGRIRSHVVEVSTRDFLHFSAPLLNFDGRRDGWIGMCSPDVRRAGPHLFEVSFNSWGDEPGRPDRLFYMTSRDLVHWSPRRPLAANLTAGDGAIDAALAHDSGRYYLAWKQGRRQMRTEIARAPRLRGPWQLLGPGSPRLLMTDGADDKLTHENFTFCRIRGIWRLLTADYGHGLRYQVLYTQAHPGDWLDWTGGYNLDIPRQSFNQRTAADAGAIYDWSRYDGYVYVIFAGRNDIQSYAHRGWNRLGLIRSRDLVHWFPAGAQ
jgi:hypothetical protein